MNIETMEGRRLFSVTVSEGYPGFYEITGDASADVIDIAVDVDAETFTLDGVTYPYASYLFVSGGGGDDTISLTGDPNGYVGASVDAGDGDDVVSINFEGSVWAGEGSDTLNLADAFRGEVYGEGGDDEIVVSGNCADPAINGGDGDDVIDASANRYGVTIQGGAGNDDIRGSDFADVIYGGSGTDVLAGGKGNDTFHGVSQASADRVDGGSGNDWLYGDLTGANVVSVEHTA